MLRRGDSEDRQVTKPRQRILRWAAFALPLAGWSFVALAFAPAQISPQSYLAEVKYLASPELKEPRYRLAGNWEKAA